jgi:virulence-associated protein VagC
MRTKVFQSGNCRAVRLPKAMELPCGNVSIRRESGKIVIEPISESGWPEGFFDAIKIDRKDFAREIPSYSEKAL